MKLTLTQLAEATGAGVVRAQNFLGPINATLAAYDISDIRRGAAFLAEIGHESGSLRWTTEIWGPTEAQMTYERDFSAPWPPKARGDRNWKPYVLGNLKAGDGELFKGHGLLQNTGRSNHAGARDRLRVRFGIRVPDFEADPDRLAEPEWAALAAGDYWESRNLNALADAGEFDAITRKVNGAMNGAEDRRNRFMRALQVLAP